MIIDTNQEISPTQKIIIPYSTSDNYCLAFVAVKQSHYDTFLSN